ncbi:MAG: redoxin domain-containing protein [Christensenellales bacterium]|jgi:peroxiredoxin|nr:redoxin domain-containing protein [Clostridiales bacterium]
MMKLEKGKLAPDFELADNQGGKVKLSDLRGKKVLLSWHPLAWTSVCTDQMRALETHFDDFEKLNTVALGLSVDSAPSKKVWADVLSIKNTKLLADFYPHGKVAQDQGLFLEELGASGRANIIIDEKGVVQWVKVYDIPELPDINEVLDVLKSL